MRRDNGDGAAQPQGARPHHAACAAAPCRRPLVEEAHPMFVLPVIPYPAINPILISIGPFAVRWYALAYIVGIIAGWFYARAIIASERLWGGPAPFTVLDFDDFVIWITLGIILGGRTGYVLFYNLAAVRRAPDPDFRTVERRHVVSRRRRRLHGRHRAVCVASAHPDAVARRRHRRRRPDRPVSRPHRQFHQRRIVGPADRRAVGHGVSQWRPDPAPSQPAL